MTWRLALAPFLAAAIVVVAAIGCARDEPADPPTPKAPATPVDPAAPTGTAAEPQAPKTPRPANTPLPPRAASKPPTPTATPTPDRVITIGHWGDQFPVLHDSQVVTAPGQMRDTMAPWRDGGGNRLFSTHVFGTPFMLNEKGEARPWIATAITSNEDFTVWTMKLREDAVFQDGTPITAADFKAYWEHGAKPENAAWGGASLTFVVAWGGASLTFEDVLGWWYLSEGDVTEAEGLRVIDDHTLEIEMEHPAPAWHLYMAAWHVGISKLEQVKADESWGNAPIGTGPFSLRYDPDSGLTELTRVDLVGKHWIGPHDTPIIEKLVLPNIEDEQARLVMFENGELDVITIDIETYEAALDPGHPLNPLLYDSPGGGLWYIKMLYDADLAPMEDLLVRKALAHGQDMEGVVSAIWGPTATHAKGLISSLVPCHNPDADPQQPYDPDLAQQQLSESTYGSGPDLPLLMIDLSRPNMVAMGVAMKEYWKDNVGVELDILKRESGMPRRAGSQMYRLSLGSWIPDPIQIASRFVRVYYGGGVTGRPWSERYPTLDALFKRAQSLPMDHPDRCAAFQAFEQEYLDKVYLIPIREIDPVRWVVQPWLRGFESTFNLDFNTLTTAYVVRH